MNYFNKNRMEKDFNYEKYNRIGYKGYQKKTELGFKCKNYDLCQGVLRRIILKDIRIIYVFIVVIGF